MDPENDLVSPLGRSLTDDSDFLAHGGETLGEPLGTGYRLPDQPDKFAGELDRLGRFHSFDPGMKAVQCFRRAINRVGCVPNANSRWGPTRRNGEVLAIAELSLALAPQSIQSSR